MVGRAQVLGHGKAQAGQVALQPRQLPPHLFLPQFRWRVLGRCPPIAAVVPSPSPRQQASIMPGGISKTERSRHKSSVHLLVHLLVITSLKSRTCCILSLDGVAFLSRFCQQRSICSHVNSTCHLMHSTLRWPIDKVKGDKSVCKLSGTDLLSQLSPVTTMDLVLPTSSPRMQGWLRVARHPYKKETYSQAAIQRITIRVHHAHASDRACPAQRRSS